MAIVKVEGLYKTFGDYRALDDVGFEFDHGILSILGPSGCGKTTMLRCIAGLEVPDDGSIWIDDKIQTDIKKGILVPPYSREIGFVFQNYALWPHMSVYQNVAFGLKLRKIPAADIRRRVLASLELVGLPKLEDRYPSQLSGGQQQRVALARSLAMEPRLILLDEPLSNLDAKLREEMRVELKKLIKKVRISAIYVTHDQEEAFVISDYVIVMERGKILQYATPDEIYNWPAHQFVASFIGRSVLVEGKVTQIGSDECEVMVPEFARATLTCRRPSGLGVGDSCQLVIRTGEVKLSSHKLEYPDNVLAGTMTSRDYRGGLTDHRVLIGSREIVITSHKFCPMITVEGDGDKVFVHIDRSAISVIANRPAISAEGAAH
ncbi:MAG TPA: ABC transporter ATP-binding protein [Verrucomicrobiae bacterium]|jgi:ABC-type Fe3+/spermidine/putrescine transport system ATPase subunit|nr:ABC transporter ATP-binding protein [Verrucomicrobiae bacterium]